LITPKVSHRAALTEPNSIGGLLRAIDQYDGYPIVRLAPQFAALVAAR
jgi:hypothetical protein